ncbi:EAL domain-containing protein [Pseudoduganella namucuonensis]|uniref:PAS domain S-box-containing protein/diguanylate cyclase (GGDEF) domain-containing protein n=1 Tax=Pseudoduganella namucuonensis TaxID=1035707 RepID=A0A1I7LE93_9BURK|nr:EAL domain-containing protein [Pseudoduganella namucuonensis]SFV08015.1 PAS domain S-box-containing protein/diguanylate cyclase (GGDEF) domain-containing protein [Pseudoduganella namucuonensis]
MIPPAAWAVLLLLAVCAITLQTRRVQRLKALVREGALFRDMINQVKDVAVTVHDMADGGQVLFANDAACLHFGVPRETLLTWRPPDWDSNLDTAAIAALHQRLKHGDSETLETTHRLASGEMVPVEVMLLCQMHEGASLTIAYTRNIHARRAEEARRLAYERAEVEQAGLQRLSRFVASTPGYFYTLSLQADGGVALPFVSAGMQDIFGLQPGDMEHNATRLLSAIHPDDYAASMRAMVESARTLSPLQGEFRIRHPEKGERWLEARSLPQREPGGATQWHGFAHDITERKRLEVLLQRRERSYRTLVENLPDPLFRYDTQCRRTYVSPAVERVTGKPAAELIGVTPSDAPLAVGADNERLMANIRQVLATGKHLVDEIGYHAPDGSVRHFQNHFGPELAADGKVVGVLSIMRDISELKRLEALLRKREQEFRALVENSPDIVSRYDLDCRRVYTNPRGVTSLGGDVTRILGTTPAELPGGESGARYLEAIRAVITQGTERSLELAWPIGGPDTCLHVRICPEFDLAGRVSQVLAIGRDITEIDEYRRVIHRQAFSDALTGLPNRTMLSDRIRQAIANGARYGHRFGLMMLDLDHFKEINDTMGHGAGDELLRMVAQRLTASVRLCDTVARLGGDEFSVLLPNMRKGDDLATVGGKVLRALAEPFVVDGQELFVSCSIGIAQYPDDSTVIDALYKYADSAMYHAKQMGRNNFQFYQPEFTRRSQERLALEAALRRAQKKGELMLYYQPQIELQSGRMVSAEALLRWRRAGGEIVPPDRFIPAAEASGLIVNIGEWVLQTACEDAVRWNRERAEPVRVAVNLSTRQFVRNDLAGTVRRILDETGCNPAWLELEITESLLLEDSRDVAATLETLHGMGLSIAIDDFGTGYSALSYLNRFPVGQLKIDRSFVHDVPEQRDKCELVKAILSIAAALRLETVAEGVETAAQAEYLMAHGCRLAQGYLFGKPMPLAEFNAVLAAKGASASWA